MRRENWIKLDLDSRTGFKMAAFFNETGATGYGLFWVLTEFLYREHSNRMANNGKTDFAMAKVCLLDLPLFCHLKERMIFHGLLQTDGDYIWRDRVLEEVAQLSEKNQEISKKRSEIGKIGASKRWQTIANDGKNARGDKIRVDKNNNISKDIPPKSDIAKKTKFGEYVFLSDVEQVHFQGMLGETVFNRCVEKLDAWIASDPTIKRKKNGQNAGACFRSWVINSISEEQSRGARTKIKTNNNSALETLGGFLDDKT